MESMLLFQNASLGMIVVSVDREHSHHFLDRHGWYHSHSASHQINHDQHIGHSQEHHLHHNDVDFDLKQ